MDSLCEICLETPNEGNVCRQCRERFRILSESEYEFETCLMCDLCDYYWFPCRNCAKYAFEYKLGLGHGSGEDFDYISENDENQPLTTDELLNVLEERHDQEEILTIISSKLNCETDIDSDKKQLEKTDMESTTYQNNDTDYIIPKKNKLSYYGKYCNIQ